VEQRLALGGSSNSWRLPLSPLSTQLPVDISFMVSGKGCSCNPIRDLGWSRAGGGETARATTSLTLREANEIVLYLLSSYEDALAPDKVPEGYSFQDLYDVEKVVVRPEYFRLYEKVKNELVIRGLNYL
jgi:hypothetical protein